MVKTSGIQKEDVVCEKCGDPAIHTSIDMQKKSHHYCDFHYREVIGRLGVKINHYEAPMHLRGFGCGCAIETGGYDLCQME